MRPARQTRSAAIVVAALAAALTGAAVPLSTSAVAAEPRTVPVAADTYVSAQTPSTSYGTSPRLRVGGSPRQVTYLRFDVPAAGQLLRGRLRLYATGASQPFEVRRVASTAGLESGLTAATAPVPGSQTVRAGGAAARRWGPAGHWLTIDVTPLLPATGVVTLALLPLSPGPTVLSSRDAGSARAPRLLLDQADTAVATPSATVQATRETQPVPHAGDAADDVAVWIHPTDPALSTIIGTDKLGGLAVYDLAGKELAYYADSSPNNVDIRYGVPLGGRLETLVVTSDLTTKALRVYRVDEATRGLEEVSARALTVGIGLYGLCTYRSAVTGKLYAFDSDSSGTLQQWELFDNGGRMDARKVRQISVGSTSEGCVADDAAGALYLSEEDVALWRYDAEPTGGTTRTAVDVVGAGRLVPDIEGLALYQGAGGAGYLIASSQGSSSYAVYERRAPNRPVGTFTIGAGPVDGVTHTDGIDVVSTALGSDFPDGLFLAQDDRNDDGNQNFKLVRWGAVAAQLLGSAAPTAAPAPTPSTGPTYYVDALAGDDTRAGTSAQTAWRTLAKATTVPLAPGASLLLARGSTWTGPLKLTGSGSAAATAVVGAYGNGPAPVIRDAGTCVSVPGSHVVVQDLEVRGCTWAGVEIGGTADTVQRTLVTDTAAGVSIKAGASDNH
ncbi:MAG: phytase, partial [Actinobacteria bacterium]|nr:phytase [Actinomycetota bacterium]